MDEVQERRRVVDARIDMLVKQIESLQVEMTMNTLITKQVADVLASFRVMAALSKWLAAIGAGVLAVYHGIDFVNHK